MGLVNRKVLIDVLGIEYQGVNGLFASILTILGVAELGIGTAIIYNLYKPLAERDIPKIQSIIQFYSKCYWLIAFAMSGIGLIISFHLPFFVTESSLPINLQVVFLLILGEIVATYTFAYKRSILQADQRNYLISTINTIFIVVANVLQLLILLYLKDYYIFLGSKLICRIIENVVVNIVVNHYYPFLKKKTDRPLDSNILYDIKQKIKGLLFHKIGTFVVNSTDNILISKFFGLALVGVYSNYFYVISSASAIVQQAFDGITGSVGNLIAVSDMKKRMLIFKQLNLLNIFISSLCVNCVLILINPFITIVFGDDYLLDDYILFALIFNMILSVHRLVYGIFKTAAGIQYEDRYVPIAECMVNLFMSLLLMHKLGLVGVYLGTTVSMICQYGITFPIFIYKKVLGGNYIDYSIYLLRTLGYYLISACISWLSVKNISMESIYIDSFVKLLCVISMNIILFWVVYHRDNSYNYIIDRMCKFIKKDEKPGC